MNHTPCKSICSNSLQVTRLFFVHMHRIVSNSRNTLLKALRHYWPYIFLSSLLRSLPHILHTPYGTYRVPYMAADYSNTVFTLQCFCLLAESVYRNLRETEKFVNLHCNCRINAFQYRQMRAVRVREIRHRFNLMPLFSLLFEVCECNASTHRQNVHDNGKLKR